MYNNIVGIFYPSMYRTGKFHRLNGADPFFSRIADEAEPSLKLGFPFRRMGLAVSDDGSYSMVDTRQDVTISLILTINRVTLECNHEIERRGD